MLPAALRAVLRTMLPAVLPTVLLAALLCLSVLALPGSVAYAELPYQTRYADPETARGIATQPLYVPVRAIGTSGSEITFSGPSDLFAAADGMIYVADTGNDRIVKLTAGGEPAAIIGADEDGPGKLNQPEGVFVTPEGEIYVADTGNRRIARFAADGSFVQAYERPESPLIPAEYFFVPTKIVVDARGVQYIVVKDSYQGLLRINAAGRFTGFFGANKTQLTLLDRLKRAVLNKRQLAKEAAKRPGTIENVALAADGFLLTSSSGVNSGQIKKLNAGGSDAFQNKWFRESRLVDLAIDEHAFLYGLNRETGQISIYDPRGEALFYFGETGNTSGQLGVLSYPTSLAVGANQRLWVADSSSSLIQVFERTAFGEAFLAAARLYHQGRYAESKPYWEEVIRQNGMLNLSFNGLGKIALHEKDYKQAMAMFAASYDAKYYSEALWNVRYVWIQQHLLLTVALLAAGAVLLRVAVRRLAATAASRVWPPYAARIGSEAKEALLLMFRPYEGFYKLKERKISWTVIVGILIAAFAVKLGSIFAMGFIFHPYDLGRVNVWLEIAILFVPWVTWVAANYLVSAVKGGEGRLREVLQASTFALMPYIVLMIPSIALSNIVVLEERIVVDAIARIAWIWLAILFFIMTQTIHNFEFTEALKNVLITLFAIVVIWIFTLIMSGLTFNLYDFLQQLYREVTVHG